MDAIVDNDILFKLACFELFDDLIVNNGEPTGITVGVLGAARYLVPKNIEKNVQAAIATAAKAAFQNFMEIVEVIEPTEDEQVMAADFELSAQRAGVALDSGESQLCAVLIARSLPHLLTGDKRAICALERLLDGDTRLNALVGKVRCLEQLVLLPLSADNYPRFRIAVCREPTVDRTLAICFSCSAKQATLEGIIEGLRSYINDLRSQANRILAA
jgi:hypothetical protein